jgi:putative membrane protein
MNQKLKEKILESLSSVLPIAAIVLALSIFMVPLDVGNVMIFLVSTVMLIIGMGMFQLGAETAMNPLGEGIGGQLSKSKSIFITIIISLLMGVLITIAEPDLQVLSNQVPSIPNSTLIWTVAIGVGLFFALAVLRILLKIDLSILLMVLYVGLLIFSFFVPNDFLCVAFDSGGVTTGPITVPFIMAMGVGLSSMRGDKDASSDSFGLVALSSVGPILAVMILGCFYAPKESTELMTEIVSVSTMQDVARAFVIELPSYAKEVFISLIPIVAVCIIFQLFSHKYQKRQVLRITVGFIYTYVGLVFFLCGVNVGFAPIGSLLSSEIASTNQKWLLIPIGMIIGYFIVKAEPAIQILNHQVQSVTNGTISEKSMMHCLSIGVAVSVGLAVLRILTGLAIQWIIIPGYLIAIIMSRFVPKIFVGIAFDSGGVASGPMTSTFLLPLCIGACVALGGNIMTDAFGVVCLVALTPLIAVQIMGLQYRFKMDKQRKLTKPIDMLPEDSDVIVELTED